MAPEERPVGEIDTQARKRSTWARFAAPAIAAAIIGAAVAANWRERVFSLVVTETRVNAGIVMLVCVAAGFVLGWAFLWSASDRD